MMYRFRASRGNILFLILLAVVLFAALSYAVTSSMRGGGKDASNENNRAAAADIMQFFSQIDTALTRMQLTGNLKPENISFRYYYKTYDSTQSYSQDNTNCTGVPCRVFEVDGGGITARTFEKYAVAAPTGWTSGTIMPGYFTLIALQWPYAGTDSNDIVLTFPAIKPSVCVELASQLGFTAAIGVTGTYTGAAILANWDNSAQTINTGGSQLIDKTTFITTGGGSGAGAYCNIYHLLFAR